MANLNLFELQEKEDRTRKPPIEPTKPVDNDFVKDKDLDDITKRVREIEEEESQEKDKKEGE